ncbi:MAG: hypothetical protein AVDCRST_MAG86-4386, partial [uncultured Truepera sp.]
LHIQAPPYNTAILHSLDGHPSKQERRTVHARSPPFPLGPHGVTLFGGAQQLGADVRYSAEDLRPVRAQLAMATKSSSDMDRKRTLIVGIKALRKRVEVVLIDGALNFFKTYREIGRVSRASSCHFVRHRDDPLKVLQCVRYGSLIFNVCQY